MRDEVFIKVNFIVRISSFRIRSYWLVFFIMVVINYCIFVVLKYDDFELGYFEDLRKFYEGYKFFYYL